MSWFYLDGKEGTSATWQNPVATAQGSSKYAWLYDNLYLCSDYGCNISDNNKYGYGISGYTNNTSGYWTSTPMFGNSLRVWFVYGYGYFNYTNASIGNYFGVRTVITISKSILK